MKRLFLFIAIAFLFISPVFSAPVTEGEAEDIAKVHSKLGAYQSVKAGAPAAAYYSCEKLTSLKSESGDKLLAYIIPLDPQGFIAISPDDNITPVIAYSFENNFNFSEDEENVLLYMIEKDMEYRLKALSLTSEKIKTTNKKLWSRYLNSNNYSDKLKAAEQWPDSDSGWIETTWNQSAPYNSLCPIDPASGKRSIVGCVATAMSQIVNFNKYPTMILFDAKKDSYTSSGAGTIVIDKDSEEYDFPSFDELNSMLADIDYLDPEEGYVPALCFACGIITQMEYSSSGSGAWFHYDDFINKLEYEDALDVKGGADDFYEILIEDMKNRRPAMIAIRTPSNAGHAIVVDGYRTTEKYHLNYGWGSTQPNKIAECWYSLPDGLPAGYILVEYGILNITSPNISANPYNAYEHAVGYPNPFRLSEAFAVRIVVPADAEGFIEEIKIFTVTGNLVREIMGNESALFIEWDGKNNAGNKCAPGLYFYTIKDSDNKVHRGKITILY